MEPRILTLHPQGKKGVSILQRRYDQVAAMLLRILEEHDNEMTFQDLSNLAAKQLEKNGFDGKPLWYIVTVKLDMEARGILERIPRTSPHRLKRVPEQV